MSSPYFWKVLLPLGFSFLLAGTVSADFVPGEVETRTIEWGGALRSYDVYQPPGEMSPAGLPVVFDFHGFTSNKETQRILSGFKSLSDREHLLMVWPQGFGNA